MKEDKRIEALKKHIVSLEELIASLKKRRAKLQDEQLIQIINKQISEAIDGIDEAHKQMEEAARLDPNKRTNGKHTPESVEEEQLDTNYDVNTDGEEISDN